MLSFGSLSYSSSRRLGKALQSFLWPGLCTHTVAEDSRSSLVFRPSSCRSSPSASSVRRRKVNPQLVLEDLLRRKTQISSDIRQTYHSTSSVAAFIPSHLQHGQVLPRALVLEKTILMSIFLAWQHTSVPRLLKANYSHGLGILEMKLSLFNLM